MAFLRDPSSDRDIPLAGPRCLIGRGPDCDIVLTDPLVSARHAAITTDAERFLLEDLKSRNGTHLNGQPIAAPAPLTSGDRIECGGHLLLFLDPTAPPSGAEAGPAVVGSVDLSTATRSEVSPAAKLRAVLELSANLSTALKLGEVLPKILESLFAIFPQSDRGFILLGEGNAGRLVPKAVRHRRAADEGGAVSRTVLDYAIRTGHAVLSADTGEDERFDASQSIRLQQLRSIMCVPLVGRSGACLGAIQIDTRERGRPFSEDDLDVLAVAGMQAARAVETTRLHDELREMEAANQIQRSFLPNERPKVPGLRFFDHYAAAEKVGGDYFDYVRLGDDRLAVAVGDVAGKGITAALLMARVSAAARFSLATEPTLAAAVRQVNSVVMRPGRDDRFVTMAVAVLDLTTFELRVVTAGHIPPLRRRGGVVEEIGSAEAGIPLGVFDKPYQECVTRLEPGDVLVLCTDGVTETRDVANDLYGLDRVRAVVTATPGDAEAVGEAILADVRYFAGGHAPTDDLTLVCLSRDG